MDKVNFIAFQFSDNDFNCPLNDAILNYMTNYNNTMLTEHLNAEWLKEYTLRAMLGFDSLRGLRRTPIQPYNYVRGREYFDSELKILLIRKMDELPTNFMGYIADIRLGNVFYMGY
jgi:hypothetical protein